jgi:hypothetical protein
MLQAQATDSVGSWRPDAVFSNTGQRYRAKSKSGAPRASRTQFVNAGVDPTMDSPMRLDTTQENCGFGASNFASRKARIDATSRPNCATDSRGRGKSNQLQRHDGATAARH